MSQSETNYPCNTVQEVKSNDTNSTPPLDDSWGIDKIVIRFAIDPNECDLQSSFWFKSQSKQGKPGLPSFESYYGILELESASCYVSLHLGQVTTASVEFNPSRFISEDPFVLAPAISVAEVFKKSIQTLESVLLPAAINRDQHGNLTWPIGWERGFWISRIDVARNFQVADPAALIQGLSKVQSRYGKTQKIYRSSGGGWTISNETKSSGCDRFYNKSAHTFNQGLERFCKADETICRFECEIRKARLELLNLRNLGDVTDANVWTAICARWEASGSAPSLIAS